MAKRERRLHGRTVIYTDVDTISRHNICDVIRDAMSVHLINRMDISYLWDYYRGKQPIENRRKKTRPEICNNIVENRAHEVVSFKVGYFCGEPIQYVARKGNATVTAAVSLLNTLMECAGKAAIDRSMFEWQMICGLSYRLCLPRKRLALDDAPFDLYSLDPRNTFVVYENRIGNKPILAVVYTTDSTGQHTYEAYTDRAYYRIVEDAVIEEKPHSVGAIPIIEYPANNARLGSFETVLPILDGINTLASSRVDGVEQFVQSFLKFLNCDISKEQLEEFLELGAIILSSQNGNNADVAIVNSELNQTQVQTLVDYMYQSVLTICGVPNRNGGSSTSDTGSAVYLRDGWSLAEAHAKDSEIIFGQSEREFLRILLPICRQCADIQLRQHDIDIKFPRHNSENILSKAQVLVTMLGEDKIHPQLAFSSCGLFSDAEGAYIMSKQHYEQLQVLRRELLIDEHSTPMVGDGINVEGTTIQNAKESKE